LFEQETTESSIFFCFHSLFSLFDSPIVSFTMAPSKNTQPSSRLQPKRKGSRTVAKTAQNDNFRPDRSPVKSAGLLELDIFLIEGHWKYKSYLPFPIIKTIPGTVHPQLRSLHSLQLMVTRGSEALISLRPQSISRRLRVPPSVPPSRSLSWGLQSNSTIFKETSLLVHSRSH